MKRVGIALLVSLMLSQPSAAQDRLAVPDKERQATATATALVGLFADRDTLTMRVRRDLTTGLRAGSTLRALEIDYPGITDYVISRVLPGAEQQTSERAPRMWAEMAAYLSANMADADVAKILDFYRGPVGIKMIAIMREMNGAPLLASAGPRVGRLTGTDVSNGVMRMSEANGGFAAKLTETKRASLLRFSNSDVGKKWQAIQPGMNAVVAQLVNSEAQTSPPTVQTDAVAAIAEYKRQHPKKAAP